MITETFHVRTKNSIAKIQLYNNSYCYFKATILSVFYKREGWFGEEKGKTSPQNPGTRQSEISEAQLPKIFFIHY